MSRLLKNWSYLLLSDISQAVISFFVFMVLARKLNPEGYGVLNVLLALASLFSVFAINISANHVIAREITINPKTTSNIFKIVFPIRMLSLAIAIFVLLVYKIYIEETHYSLIAATAIIVAATMLWDLAESIAFGHFVTKLTTLVSMISNFLWLVIVILLPNENLNVDLVIWLYACLFLLRGIMYVYLSYSKFVKVNNEPAVVNLNAIIFMSMPFLWMRVVGTLGEQIPILLLKGYSGFAEVGYYAVGSRFVMPITMAVSTGMRALFPFLTKLFQEDKESFNKKLVEGFTFVLIIGATLAGALTISSGIWLPLFFGNEYQKSVEAFNYQAWFGVLLCFDLLLATVLTSTYMQKALAIITTIDVFILFPLMYFGARYGAEGMAIAKLIGAVFAISYHIVVVIFKMKIELFSNTFFLSVLYFLIFMLTSIFIPLIPVKLLIIFITIIIFIIVKSSPLRILVDTLIIKIKGR